MDGTRFDALTRGLARSGSRRRFLGGVLTGSLSLLGARTVDAASCRTVGEICREDSNCCSQTCGAPDRTGRRKCNCGSATDCPAPKVCRTVVCTDGGCVTSVTPGAPCATGAGASGICQGVSCVPTSGTTTGPTSTITSTTTEEPTTTTTTTTADPNCFNEFDVCSIDGDCCNGLFCYDLGEGGKRCAADNCKGFGFVCTTDAECCFNSFGAGCLDFGVDGFACNFP